MPISLYVVGEYMRNIVPTSGGPGHHLLYICEKLDIQIATSLGEASGSYVAAQTTSRSLPRVGIRS